MKNVASEERHLELPEAELFAVPFLGGFGTLLKTCFEDDIYRPFRGAVFLS